MRFKKGAMVEVFCQTENPAGSWRCAEIIRGNGHNFIVKYYSGMNEQSIEEKVPRKFIRPSSPKMNFLENWKPGDIIEVLHNFSWKMATVSRVLSRGKFLVSLVGFFEEFEVSKSDIRLRQSFVDGKWVVIGKSVMNNDSKRSQKESLKRKSSYHHSQAEVCGQKFRKKENDGDRYPVYFQNVSQLPEKVNGTNETRTKGDGVGCSTSISSGRYDNDDDTCSTSCSSVCSNDPLNWLHTTVHPVEIEKDDCSDAESICWLHNKEMHDLSFTREEMAAEIHRLELHAYRCTLEALHASGILSWEQELLMTSLRISLHISNDEHLMELRTLISNSKKSLLVNEIS
ncbi:hypothetical protein LIER_36506 [Lithospermum erythrorhizon]|uniref:ENT domain-containing protein n=1 Tax=Lithospermum erythrorhizon TaxID=34254 RepID=A0AAV3P6S5_LITER